ncbi:MAG: hypothetical protein ACAI38_06110 [Myxococcota bacterium]|nr:hypothetical protein [Myxococcota bacterium]
MADDDRRVEARLGLIGRGSATTPERIADLEARARESERLNKAKPTKSFAAMVNTQATPEPEKKKPARQKKERELKSTPRPGLAHPSQRQTFGREDAKDDTVVLKG